MKKFYNLFFLVVLMIAWVHTSAQTDRTDLVIWKTNIPGLEIPPLVFSEFRGDNNSFYYVELTNVGQTTLDLSNFSILSVSSYTALENATTDSTRSLRRVWNYIPLEGSLPAGESYVMTSVFDVFNAAWDGLPRHNVAILNATDLICHQPEPNIPEFLNKPEWEAYAWDSISTLYPSIAMSGSSGYYLEYKFTNGEGLRDSTIIDNVNVSIDPFAFNGRGDQGGYQTPVAGVTDAIANYILVRKSSVTQGTVDWDLSRGTDLATSEWLPVPVFQSKLEVFTTVGSHGNYSLDYSVKNPGEVILDTQNKTLTVPWESPRDQTLSKEFNMGTNMSWAYTENATDSVYTNARNGDIFTLYALSDQIEQIDLTIQVSPPAADLAIVFPTRYRLNFRDFETGRDYWEWIDYYRVTSGLDTDSIYNVPFGTRMDTLFKYLQKPENATWEVITGDEDRADVKEGDILRVTAQNGTTIKDYILKLNDYIPSSNANLSMISWPDVNLDEYWLWASDTIPGFNPQASSYFIQLVAGTTNIPALQFKTQNLNAKIEVARATDINGSLEQRTTSVKVTAEDGVATKTYKIEFRIETVPTQPNYAEPFISELMMGMNFAYAVEIYNPGNQELDLNRYMLLRGTVNQNFGEAVTGGITTNNLNNIYKNYYVPGMRFQNDLDLTAYKATPGILTPDNITNTIVQPGDVWVAGTINDGGWPGGRFYPDRNFEGWTDGSRLDFIWYGWSFQEPDTQPGAAINDQYNLNPWGVKPHRYYHPAFQDMTTSLFLVKILNDSVLNGSKAVTDPDDYEIIDRWQKPLEIDSFYLAGRYMNEYNTNPANGWSVTRKPYIWKGVTERGEGLGDNFGRSAENADWIVFNSRDLDHTNAEQYSGVGWHSMDPVRTFMSTVTSKRLNVTPGYDGDLSITGSVNGLKVSEITAIIDKADPGQTLVFLNGADTLNADQEVAADMNLVVTSADGQNTSTYKLVNSPLDSNNLLVAVEGSGLTVSLSDAVGSVAGVSIGTTISSLLDNLVVPSKAVLNVIGQNNDLLSLKSMNYDSVLVDRVVGAGVFLEVVAENGDAAVYSIDFGISASEAVLFSNVLSINQEVKAVYDVPEGISVSGLMSLVYANQNATANVIDKLGFERTAGRLYQDDAVEVISEDKSVTVVYSLNFIAEANMAPVVSISGPTEVVNSEALNYSATVMDDGLPVGSTITYLWEVTSGNTASVTIANPDQLTTDITFTAAGTYELSFTATDGELSTKVSTTVSSAVGIDNFDNPSVRVYPNPAREVLFVEFENKNSQARVRLVNITGSVVFDNSNVNSKLEIGLDDYASGIYFLSIEIDNNVLVHKVSISKRK